MIDVNAVIYASYADYLDRLIMVNGKKKKSKKKDTAALEENAKSWRRFLKLYDKYSNEQNSSTCPEVTRNIRLLMEEGENLTKVTICSILTGKYRSFQAFLRPIPPKRIKSISLDDDPLLLATPPVYVRISSTSIHVEHGCFI
jgi:hypothetical protein